MGTGRLVAPKTLEVRLNDGGTRVLAGDQVFLNVGTHAAIPNIPGLEAARHLTDIEGSGEQKIERSDTLVAAGRTPNTAGIGLEEAGIELDDRGYIRVDDRLETSACLEGNAVRAIGWSRTACSRILHSPAWE